MGLIRPVCLSPCLIHPPTTPDFPLPRILQLEYETAPELARGTQGRYPKSLLQLEGRSPEPRGRELVVLHRMD